MHPTATIELLLVSTVETVARHGAEYLTMGLVPLARQTWDVINFIRCVRIAPCNLSHKYGQRFYNFDGPETFKAKIPARRMGKRCMPCQTNPDFLRARCMPLPMLLAIVRLSERSAHGA